MIRYDPTLVKLSDCGTIDDFVDGTVVYLGGTTFQAEATFTCHTGYDLSADVTRTCLDDSTWSDANPTCIIAGKGCTAFRRSEFR